ncbi:hypothetical protein Y032_0165g26 [Ancylostoma ceylanicum]|uniref:Uncharacterized protein n=1 Tax=Ancylostoma ceylanicum TaxID=53326 RepID=A0A016SX05_9BILA|nr:hypothetical protein Y032_0165g26 [Ancylostoma ceylanicum]
MSVRLCGRFTSALMSTAEHFTIRALIRRTVSLDIEPSSTQRNDHQISRYSILMETSTNLGRGSRIAAGPTRPSHLQRAHKICINRVRMEKNPCVCDTGIHM